MRYFPTMFLSRFIHVRSCAGTLILALGLGGVAYASSTTSASKKKAHASAHPHHTAPERTHTSSSHKASLHHTSYSSRHHRSRHHHSTITGQRVMDASRATEIQQALIQAHYLNGTPTGQWDADTQAAMVKYQADNGWQSKITPDSRALIKLGLGPKQDAGEYAAHPAGISEISSGSTASAGAPTDTIRTMATSEIPMATSNN
ncbi:MAG TPA: peptidoglycan-binding domain-containing protein [Acidobacteriaceae bacterium]|nr:peptidoglycan-binding domain-containing protein [Acidobacteriaceae bacterium]